MTGTLLTTVAFPATERPSAGFMTRFERGLRAVADDALGAPLTLALDNIVEASFETCLEKLGTTTRHVVVAIDGVHALASIPDAVLHALIEVAYGGDNSEPAPAPATPTRLAARFGYRIATAFVGAIAPTLGTGGVVVRGATDVPEEAVTMAQAAVACSFCLHTGDVALGSIALTVPVHILARVEIGHEVAVADQRWEHRIERALSNTRLDVRCVLARPTLAAGEVARLRLGSVIPIPTLDEVALIAGGYRIATGSADARNGRAAIVIQRTEFQA